MLFNLYTNSMIKKLNEIHSGYCLNGNIINNLCYADDIALFSSSLGGLQLLISCCEEFATNNCLCGSVAKASDTQAVGHGFDPRPDHYLIL